MIDQIKENLWSQFGASVDSLEKAITLCPENILVENKRLFYMTYHILVFLDYYVTIPPENFSPKLPYTITDPENLPENAIDDLVPNRFYTKTELLDYLQSSREKCRNLIAGLTEEKIKNERFVEDFESDAMNYSILEILLYNMRHVQHHAAQLNMILRQEINDAPKWVFRAKEYN
ncbi:DinB family protein [Dyadobacter subterraneus]|uniref:DinB family protein n=1 Tax=Dyadobacter subterraneus TaxID=2773304 RepID=A0ABR9WEM1_9BACT|nr:DinB family protein [Dyadobacter subterraneus]MBE9463948.1 DinB family protein [Dyadobacter subterraneus]